MMELVYTNIGFFLEMWMVQIYLGMAWGERICFRAFSWILFVTNGIVLTCINLGILPKFFAVFIYILMFGYGYVKFKKGLKESIVRFCMMFMLVWITEVISGVLAVFIRQYIKEESGLLILVNCISVNVALLLRYVASRKRIKVKSELEYKAIFKMMVVCFIPLGILLLIYFLTHEIRIWYTLLIIFEVMIFLYFDKLQKSEYKVKQKELELNMNKVYGGLYEEVIMDVRRKQHEFQNQLAAVYSSHKVAASFDELVKIQKNYCNLIQEDNANNFILTSCNEPILASFLYYKCRAFKEQEVETVCDVHVSRWNCDMTLHEAIEILGILLDNAYEKELENAYEEKTIDLGVVETESAIRIRVSNRIRDWSKVEPDKMFQTGYSTKGENRGLGLSRVKQICDSYGLEIEVSIKQKGESKITFELTVPKK